MKRWPRIGRELAIPGLFLALAVILYNIWSYCCGRCTLKTFFTLSPYEVLLLAGVAVAGAVLLGLRVKNRALRSSPPKCSCGEPLETQWEFCPRCGKNGGSVTAE